MKKLLLTVTLSLACVAAFAQGKVNFINDSLHLIYFTTDTSHMLAADTAWAGAAYLNTYSAQGLTVELWAGTSSTSLSLQSTTDFTGQTTIGKWNPRTVTLTGIPAGLTYFTVDVYATAAGTYMNAAGTNGFYYGTSGLFTAVGSSTIAYNSIVNHNSPALSTWADGTYHLDSLAPGYRGAIMLQVNQIPEPTTFALAGLCAAALMIFRRRK
jgi:hypothetical protein